MVYTNIVTFPKKLVKVLNQQLKQVFKFLPFFIFLLLFQSNFVKAEVQITFDLEECLKKSTHIFRGVIIDNKGTIAIHEVLRGKSRLKHIRLPHLYHGSQIGEYGPNASYVNWELIVFTKQDSLSKNVYHPAPIIQDGVYDYSAFNQAVTTLWVKRDSAYQAFSSPDYYGTLIFGNWGPISRYLDRIENNDYFHKKLSKIKRKRSCKKKMQLLSNLHTDPRYNRDAYLAILELNCQKQVVEFLYQRLPKDTFTFQHSRELKHYIRIGKGMVVQQTDAIFEKEFTFWKMHIASHPEEKWWKANHENNPRFVYFSILITSLIQYQVGDSSTKADQVYSYFDTLSEYNQAKNIQVIQEQIDYYRKYFVE